MKKAIVIIVLAVASEKVVNKDISTYEDRKDASQGG